VHEEEEVVRGYECKEGWLPPSVYSTMLFVREQYTLEKYNPIKWSNLSDRILISGWSSKIEVRE
jgi:hypothetical protein